MGVMKADGNMINRIRYSVAAVFLAAAVLLSFIPAASAATEPLRPGPRGTVSISGAWALYPLAVKWREEFNKVYPGITVDVQAGGAGKGVTDVLAGAVDIGMVSREINPVEKEKGIVAMAVARDAVVAVFNVGNPAAAAILKHGVTGPKFAAIWIKSAVKDWESAMGATSATTASARPTALNVYTRSDACGAAETWAAFLGGHQEDLQGIGVYGDPGLAEAVRRDPYGLGYNNINYAYDPKTGLPINGLAVCPLDRNGNGLIDPEESFYSTRAEIVAAIARGAYPAPPSRDLYFVVKNGRFSKDTALFLRWVLTEGRKYIGEMGYIELGSEAASAALKMVDAAGEAR